MDDAPTGMPPFRDWRAWLARAASHDTHPFIQFVKYGIAGGFALLTDLVFFTLSNIFLFPIDPDSAVRFPAGGLAAWGPWLSEMRHDPSVINYVRCNFIGFLFSNITAYILNVKWVFRGGRHRRHLEITLFLVASVTAFVLGTAIGAFLVGSFGLNEYLAKAGNVVGAVLINYVCRKFIVFKG